MRGAHVRLCCHQRREEQARERIGKEQHLEGRGAGRVDDSGSDSATDANARVNAGEVDGKGALLRGWVRIDPRQHRLQRGE